MENRLITSTWYSQNNLIESFREGLFAVLNHHPKSLIILSCSDNQYCENTINSILLDIQIPIFGGIYPHVFFDKKLLEKGVLFIGLKETLNIHEFHIDNQTSDELALHIENNLTLNKETSCLIFYDALMEKTEVFLEALYSTLDRELTIAGGGAGHLDFQQKPCIYSNSGLKSNCVQLVALPYSLSTGIGHGWEILAGPFLVTESQGSNIASLNYQDAFTVYKQTVEILSNYKFEKHEFFEISKHFPFGIENINGDLLVRDPIVLNKSSIQCVGNVPSSSMVYILKGQKPALIKSVDKALKTAHTENSATTIVFDCISRKLYLEEDFKQELEMLFAYKVGDLLFGVLSLGEIANDRGGAMKLYNKSTVIGCL